MAVASLEAPDRGSACCYPLRRSRPLRAMPQRAPLPATPFRRACLLPAAHRGRHGCPCGPRPCTCSTPHTHRLWLVRVPKPPEVTALAALEQELAAYTQQVKLLNESASVKKVGAERRSACLLGTGPLPWEGSVPGCHAAPCDAPPAHTRARKTPPPPSSARLHGMTRVRTRRRRARRTGCAATRTMRAWRW